MSLRTAIPCFLLALMAANSRAEDPIVFQRILVPVSVGQIPGAYGSLWSTELWFRNNSGRAVSVFPLSVSDWNPLPGRTERLPIENGPAEAPASFIYTTRPGSEDVQFDLRLFNRADPKDSWGTKIPVVRDDELRTGTVYLIHVPTTNDFRAALRIYGLPEHGADAQIVIVRLYGYPDKLLATTTLTFDRQNDRPRYAQILSLSDLLPETSKGEPVTIAVESSDPAARLWAFVSVTANATQHVSIITRD